MMLCKNCMVPMIFTGAICLCGHKQYLCQKCRHIWIFNHKTPGDWEINLEIEKNIRHFLKNKLHIAKTYDSYINEIISKWKKGTKSRQ